LLFFIVHKLQYWWILCVTCASFVSGAGRSVGQSEHFERNSSWGHASNDFALLELLKLTDSVPNLSAKHVRVDRDLGTGMANNEIAWLRPELPFKWTAAKNHATANDSWPTMEFVSGIGELVPENSMGM
jgi:hypothetical protein